MKIKYLGTAAAEGIPAIFCECPICQKAKKLGGKDIRSRTQALINDDLLIDYPPDSFYHFSINDIDISKIHDIIITHAHEDHFYPWDFAYFLSGFSHPDKCLPVTIHGSEDLYEPLKPYLDSDRNQGLRYERFEPFKTYPVGKYAVTPLMATHGTPHPYVYIVSDGVKTMLYCHDSGIFKREETWAYLRSSGVHFDLISLDCTEGLHAADYDSHMRLESNRIMVAKFKELGLIDEHTKVVINHFSHNGLANYDDLVNASKGDGFIVAYDGLEIEF